MRRGIAILLLLVAAGSAFAFHHRHPNKPAPQFPALTPDRQAQLLNSQKVVPEVGAVPLKTGAPSAAVMPQSDDSAAHNVAGAFSTGSHAKPGAGVLKQIEADLENHNKGIVGRLPALGCLLAFLFMAGYVGIRYLDLIVPYRPKKKRTAKTQSSY